MNKFGCEAGTGLKLARKAKKIILTATGTKFSTGRISAIVISNCVERD